MLSPPHYNPIYPDNRDVSAKIATSTPVVSVPPFAFLSRRMRETMLRYCFLQLCNPSDRESHPASLLLGLWSTLHPSSRLPQHPDFVKSTFSRHNTPAGQSGCRPLRWRVNSVTQSAAQRTSQPTDHLYYKPFSASQHTRSFFHFSTLPSTITIHFAIVGSLWSKIEAHSDDISR